MLALNADQVPAAEAAAREQRRQLARLIKMDKKRAGNPADIAMCERVIAAARDNFKEYESLLRFAEVNRLFARGALYMGRRRVGA